MLCVHPPTQVHITQHTNSSHYGIRYTLGEYQETKIFKVLIAKLRLCSVEREWIPC